MHENETSDDLIYNPNPSPNPEPGSIPGTIPEPIPEPWPPSNWWRCLRRVPVSGRYYGKMTSPTADRYALDLRVDIDPRYANSPVMDRISGDIYQVYTFRWFGKLFKWKIFKESWIVDNPTVNWTRCSVEIKGQVRYWKGGHPPTAVRIDIGWAGSTIGPVIATFRETVGESSAYSCTKKSVAFRDVTLEVDFCDSVKDAPTLPEYDTDDHSNCPTDLSQRVLSIEEAYMEAGIDLTLNPAHTIIDDSDPEFTSWSPEELHDAMETHFSKYPGTWPKWHMWCLLAGTFDSPSVGGIMFDARAAYGGAGEAPERQGCAVFRNHSWFNNLVTNPPANDTEAAAMRKFLYTYVHEIGHAFNFLHSWDKGRPDALSWMNYDWKYDNRNGADSFWGNFYMRFDDDEIIHMRHGDRASVIMGGDPWASGGHLEAPSGAMSDLVGEAPVQLLLRSKGYFQFMEPVIMELRLRNDSDMNLELDVQLNPEFGGVIVYIRRPDGRILQYAPILCKLATPVMKVLLPKPKKGEEEGNDRHSQNVLLSYGAYGYYFDEPGEYLVRAIYQGAGDLLIPSNVLRVRVGRPYSKDDEVIAQDFFTYETGMALYLNGSGAESLKGGMKTLEYVTERYKETPLGGQLAQVLAHYYSRQFYQVNVEDYKLEEVRPANPKMALSLTTQSMEQQERDDKTFTNIGYHKLVRQRADLMVKMGDEEGAKKELNTLVKSLEKKGVNKPVLDEIKAYAKKL